jgi:hypothetical protein
MAASPAAHLLVSLLITGDHGAVGHLMLVRRFAMIVLPASQPR